MKPKLNEIYVNVLGGNLGCDIRESKCKACLRAHGRVPTSLCTQEEPLMPTDIKAWEDDDIFHRELHDETDNDIFRRTEEMADKYDILLPIEFRKPLNSKKI